MKFGKVDTEFYAPDGVSFEEAAERTTILGVGAHPDDLEIIAIPGIVNAYHDGGHRFFGVVTTSGGGTMRSGDYAGRTYREMRAARSREQKEAADIGKYAGLLFLQYESNEIKDPMLTDPDADLQTIFEAVQPDTVYIHHPFDRHDTHVAVSLRCISALRKASAATSWKPKHVYGAEGWRSLDWLVHYDRAILPVRDTEHLSDKLIQVYKSQMMAEKEFDLAARSRRVINATYEEARMIGAEHEISFAVDLTPLVLNPKMKVEDFVAQTADHFRADVLSRVSRFSSVSPDWSSQE